MNIIIDKAREFVDLASIEYVLEIVLNDFNEMMYHINHCKRKGAVEHKIPESLKSALNNVLDEVDAIKSILREEVKRRLEELKKDREIFTVDIDKVFKNTNDYVEEGEL
jgi:hypothetical protein